MAEEVKLDGVEDVDRCLVGKVLSRKKVNREAFKDCLSYILLVVKSATASRNVKIWRPGKQFYRGPRTNLGPSSRLRSQNVRNPAVKHDTANKGSDFMERRNRLKDEGCGKKEAKTRNGVIKVVAAQSSLKRKIKETLTTVGGIGASVQNEMVIDGSGFEVDDSVGNNGGILLLWKDYCGVTALSSSLGHIDAHVCFDNGFCWRFTGFYGDPTASKSVFSWNLLRRLMNVDNLSWVCGGDFNELLSVHHKVGGSTKSFSDISQFM
ncbi:hypothetical protein EZV62_024386 [Acer yangbiense]|uniref:Endonuclease/exonuclease/phosphatase domain-containing protein n=1 Tax=Acer yangbiense TaxID=1000413 RepID=A0A5C7GUU9_9ROSI|nr:hypothetical protein EZV62_024386 [Acer yangbiense]